MKLRSTRTRKLAGGIGLALAVTLLASGCSVTGAGQTSGAEGE